MGLVLFFQPLPRKWNYYKITTLDVINPDEGKRANEIKQKFSAQCGTPLFIDAETGNSVCGFREKDVLEKWAKGEEIPKPPQPKSPPPLFNSSRRSS